MYEVVKDLLLPLIGPAIGIIVPTVFFFILPRRRERQKMALDLFATFNTEEFRRARLEVWAHFVIQPAGDLAEQNRRWDQYLNWFTDSAAKLTPETMDLVLKMSRVLDFFALLEGCIRQGLVNEELVRLFLARYYLWWRDSVLVPLRRRGRLENEHLQVLPLWWHPFIHLDRVAGVPASLAVPQERLAIEEVCHNCSKAEVTALDNLGDQHETGNLELAGAMGATGTAG